MIAVEGRAINRMTHTQCLAKSIHDTAWSQFIDLIAYKAASAGWRFVAVNPAYTSQDCARSVGIGVALPRRPHLDVPLLWTGAGP